MFRALSTPSHAPVRFVPRKARLRSLWPAGVAAVALAAFLVGATSAAAVDASINARAPAPVTRLAWFYMRNTDSTPPQHSLPVAP